MFQPQNATEDGEVQTVQTGEPAGPHPQTINEAVASNLQKYFQDLDGSTPSAIYDMVLRAVERPMLEVVMHEAAGNQSRASELLGINRNTLRKKLQQHGML
jgi:Fis family transcriptional regulator